MTSTFGPSSLIGQISVLRRLGVDLESLSGGTKIKRKKKSKLRPRWCHSPRDSSVSTQYPSTRTKAIRRQFRKKKGSPFSRFPIARQEPIRNGRGRPIIKLTRRPAESGTHELFYRKVSSFVFFPSLRPTESSSLSQRSPMHSPNVKLIKTRNSINWTRFSLDFSIFLFVFNVGLQRNCEHV